MYDMQSMNVYHLQQIYTQDTESSSLFEVVASYHIKINLALSGSASLCALRLQYESIEA